jgi:DNA-directed RNA polymerase specialized sigma24 family protein
MELRGCDQTNVLPMRSLLAALHDPTAWMRGELMGLERRERELREAIHAEDEALVAEILAGYLPALATYVRCLVPSTVVDPEDVADETYLRAARRIGKFDFDARPSLLVWLQGIAKKVVQEQRGRRWPLELDEIMAGMVSARIEDPLARVERADDAMTLYQRLSSLPCHYRAILVLRADGRSIPEIARRLGKDRRCDEVAGHASSDRGQGSSASRLTWPLRASQVAAARIRRPSACFSRNSRTESAPRYRVKDVMDANTVPGRRSCAGAQGRRERCGTCSCRSRVFWPASSACSSAWGLPSRRCSNARAA